MLFVITALGQKFNLSLNYSQINDAHIWKFLNTSGGLESFQENKIKPEFSMSLSYPFIKNLDAGIYLGYSGLSGSVDNEGVTVGAINSYTNATGLLYGLNAHYQLLPLITNKPLRLNVFATTQCGVIDKRYRFNYKNYIEYTFETGAGLGLAYNFTRNFGIYGEAMFGSFYYSNFNWKAGLTFKL